MRQLGRPFLTLWMAIFGPSLMVWLLWIRGSDAGPDQFRTTLDWLSDHLAYPLIFSPLTDWAWSALDRGAFAAVVAFLILVAVWTTVVTFPIMFVIFWWVVVAQLTSSSTSTGIAAPSGAIYLITFLPALLWAGLRWVTAPDPYGTRPFRRFFSPVFAAFLVGFALVTAGLLIAFATRDSYWEQRNMLAWVQSDAWYGYLNTLMVPALMEDSFTSAVEGAAHQLDIAPLINREASLDPSRPEVRTMILLLAARHAIVAAAVVLVLRSIWWFGIRKVKT